MKHIAHLSDGGQVEITLPLHSTAIMGYPESWRVDENGVLINLAQVLCISGAPVEDSNAGKKLVALIDNDGERWSFRDGSWYLGAGTKVAWRRSEIDQEYGISKEVWE